MATAKKLPSGSWRVRVYAGRDENKKPIYKSFTASTKKQAEFEATSYINSNCAENSEEQMTVFEAMEKYIENKSAVLSPTTIHEYKNMKETRFKSLQDIKLADLTTEDIQSAVNIESKKASPKSVKNAYGLLSATLKTYRPEWMPRVTLAAPKKHIIELPAPEAIINATKGTTVELPVLLAMWLSLRMSEIRGIRKQDIKDGYLTVNGAKVVVGNKDVYKASTKTYNSTRKLKLPKRIQDLIPETPDDFIITMSAQAIYNKFQRLLKKNNIDHIRFHDLRHINASVMAALGVPDKYAMERGGWSTTDTLQRVYQHTFSEERKKIDDKIDNYFDKLYDTKYDTKNNNP